MAARSWVLFALSMVVVSGTAFAGAASDRDGAPIDEGKDAGPLGEARALRVPANPAAEAALLEAESDTDVIHYSLDLEVIPEYTGMAVTAVRVEGVNTIDFEAATDGLTTFTLDLHSALTVNAVTGDVASWTRVGNTIEISLDQSYDAGDPVQVVVDYEGYPQSAGFGAFRWWIRNGELVVATLSEPFYARYWWPCKDALDDKASMDTYVTVPSDMIALSNGVESGSLPLSGSRTQYLWHETHPIIPYLASLAISSYERYELAYIWDDAGSPALMSVPCYLYPDHWDGGAGEPLPAYKTGCDEIVDMLETLSGLFGEYPFVDEKYGVVETGGSGGLGANMEHQTLSSMYRVDAYSNIMAHELAHQWWGDDVTCETWYDIWLNEGITSYGEALYREYRPGGSPTQYWNRMNTRRPTDPDAQVYRSDISTTSAIFDTNDVYNKGAWVLHMLRHLLGDSAFFAFLIDYRGAYSGDSATTAEFSAALSASFGEDLDWFVDQWVSNPGSPDYEWNYANANIDGQDYLKLSISQTQDLEGFGLITMPIDIRVLTSSGFATHTVWNDAWNEYYVIPLDSPALTVEFDEDGGSADHNWVLSDTRTQVVAPLESPPILLSADVAVAESPAGDVTIELVFSEDIGDFDSADIALIGATSGAHAPASVGYDAGTLTATIGFSALPVDTYTLTVFAVDVLAYGKALDGEVDAAAWWDDALFTSGDGQPGGDAGLSFAVTPAVPGASPALRAALVALLSTAGLVALAAARGRAGQPACNLR